MTPKVYKNLREIAPHLVAEWDVERNGSNNLENFQNECGGYPHWICSRKHQWQMRIDARVKQNQGCPFCSGRRAIPGETDLSTKFPEIAVDWNYSRNGDFKPSDFKPFSHDFVWWDCPDGHDSYHQQISKRTGRGTGCPECSKGRGNSKGEFELGEFLKSLDIDYIQGSRKFLQGMELDFYVGSRSLGVEFNGEWTHSNSALKPHSKDKTARDYHLRKLGQADARNVDLAFVWEHDWEEHRPEVEKAITSWLQTEEKSSLLTRITSFKDIEKDCCSVKV